MGDIEDNENAKKVPVNIYQCSECPYLSHYRGALKDHVVCHKKPSEVNIIKCQKCPKKFSRQKYLNRHLREIHAQKKRRCKNCLFETTNRTAFKEHFVDKTCLNKTMFKCKKCPFKADLRIKVTKHEKTHDHTVKRKYKCPQCQLVFSGWVKLSRHKLQSHQNIFLGQYNCEFCSFKSSDHSSFETHKKTHSDLVKTGLIICSHCNAQYFNMTELNNHIKTQHLYPTDKNYKCFHCGFKTDFHKNILEHTQNHLNNGEIQKSEAEKVFNELKVQKTYKCDKCSYKTTVIKSLKEHLQTHNGDGESFNPFVHICEGMITCLHCGSQSVYKSFRRHFQIHVRKGEMSESEAKNATTYLNLKYSYVKQFKCRHCGYLSAHTKLLNRHIQGHIRKGEISEGEAKSVRCKLNEEQLTVKKNLKCLGCGFQTLHKSSLRRHLQSHVQKGEITKSEVKNYGINLNKRKEPSSSMSLLMPKIKKSVVRRTYTCPRCPNFRSIYYASLDKHLKLHMKKGNMTQKEAKAIMTSQTIKNIKLKKDCESTNLNGNNDGKDKSAGIRDKPIEEISMEPETDWGNADFDSVDEIIKEIFDEDTIAQIDKVYGTSERASENECLNEFKGELIIENEPTRIDDTSSKSTLPAKKYKNPKSNKIGQRRFNCSECKFFCYNILRFKAHIDTHQNPDASPSTKYKPPMGPKAVYKCKYCSIVLYCRNSLQSHTNVHAKANQDLTLKVSFERYVNKKVIDVITVQAAAPVKRKREKKYLKDEKINENEIVYSCGECKFTTNVEESLQNHKKLHWSAEKDAAFDAQKWHVCKKCNFHTFDMEVYKKHVDFHKTHPTTIELD